MGKREGIQRQQGSIPSLFSRATKKTRKRRETGKSQRTLEISKKPAGRRVSCPTLEILTVQLRSEPQNVARGFGSRHRDAENALHFVPSRDIPPRFYRHRGPPLSRKQKANKRAPSISSARGRDACGCAWFQVSFARTVISSPIFCLVKGCVPGRGGGGGRIGSSCWACSIFLFNYRFEGNRVSGSRSNWDILFTQLR